MSKNQVVMPQMGESITTGTITKWHKKVGDKIEIDEILLDISTDKVESEIPSPYSGKVVELLYKEGDTIDVGRPIATIDDDMNAAVSASSAPAEKAAAPATKKESSSPAPTSAPAAVANNAEANGFYTPLVKAMAKEHGIALAELDAIHGSGAGGRVNRADFENYLKTRGSGASVSKQPAGRPATMEAPKFEHGKNTQIIPMDNMRKTIAKNMAYSKQVAPHVNSIDEVDMTNLVKFRETFKDEFKKQEGFALTYTHFVLYTLVQALKEFPMVNASIDGDNIIVKKDINIGCAVAVPGSGLVVPVIKGADNLSLTGIARKLNELVIKAKSKKLTMDDLTGGTYTFTNNGSFGVLAATPVILQPQVGIFCVGAIKKRPVVLEKENAIAIRDMMYATHTYDHRLVDGELGSMFLRFVVQKLESLNAKELFL
ncbi:MAG: 2-oxo acid dehydrogenase subunit E2 [Bacteriovoracaceae bacterium]|nr:2-oxo acid dehydrogenase subunit E2 [Bacteriovoracaceae bacterium]